MERQQGETGSDTHLELVEGFPDLLDLHTLNPARYPFLLESVAHGTTEARFDILFAFPQSTLTLGNNYTLKSSDHELNGHDFLDNLDSWWKTSAVQVCDDIELPFQGGWFLYLGYELAAQVEPGLKLPESNRDSVIASATRIPAAVIRDHVTQRCWIVCENNFKTALADIRSDLDLAKDQGTSGSNTVEVETILEDEDQRYLDAVEKIRDYIIEGDVFQVNLSRRWTTQTDCDNNILYRSLRENNPAPFAGIANLQGMTVMSSSPERLVSVKGNSVDTRPIAGTRPRGSKLATDQQLSGELLAHPKERAEHIMLIDLERNDLGRVCIPGSIEVNELMVLESYAHVHHIVSNVRGTLRKEISPGQVIRAVFPGGTITGCPKVRCMEIIAELEQTARGAYTGSMGYLNHNGDMDLNILIRTMTRKANTITLRAGAGIVADSVAENELSESRDKAKGLLRALGVGKDAS